MLDLAPIKEQLEAATRPGNTNRATSNFMLNSGAYVAALIAEVERLRAENEQHAAFERQVSDELDRMIQKAKDALGKNK